MKSKEIRRGRKTYELGNRKRQIYRGPTRECGAWPLGSDHSHSPCPRQHRLEQTNQPLCSVLFCSHFDFNWIPSRVSINNKNSWNLISPHPTN